MVKRGRIDEDVAGPPKAGERRFVSSTGWTYALRIMLGTAAMTMTDPSGTSSMAVIHDLDEFGRAAIASIEQGRAIETFASLTDLPVSKKDDREAADVLLLAMLGDAMDLQPESAFLSVVVEWTTTQAKVSLSRRSVDEEFPVATQEALSALDALGPRPRLAPSTTMRAFGMKTSPWPDDEPDGVSLDSSLELAVVPEDVIDRMRWIRAARQARTKLGPDVGTLVAQRAT
jgi:hypothetical protein